MLVSVTSEAPMKVSATATNHSMPSMPSHPAYPLGHYHQLLYMSTQATVADILQQVSGMSRKQFFILGKIIINKGKNK